MNKIAKAQNHQKKQATNTSLLQFCSNLCISTTATSQKISNKEHSSESNGDAIGNMNKVQRLSIDLGHEQFQSLSQPPTGTKQQSKHKALLGDDEEDIIRKNEEIQRLKIDGTMKNIVLSKMQIPVLCMSLCQTCLAVQHAGMLTST